MCRSTVKGDGMMENLTLEEKARLVTGVGGWHTYDCNGKVPSIMMTDGPHGIRKQLNENDFMTKNKIATCFPLECALACSWDTDAVSRMSEAIGEEALAEKISIVLGCGVNIKRSPLCGRNFEYFSEDPYLSGVLGAAYINTMQNLGVGTSLKHFAVNNQETHRYTSNSEVDERALHEIYLSAFEYIVKNAQPLTIMSSYNMINGVHSTGNKKLLTDILRKEWGFKGAVISDWGAAVGLDKCLKAGMDLEMPDSLGIHTKQLLKSCEDGHISEDEINRAADNVLTLAVSQAEKIKDYKFDFREHHKTAEEIECECAVLLKNNNMLPLDRYSKVLVIGDLAQNMRFQGGGSSHITTNPVKNAVEAMRELGVDVTYRRGYKADSSEVNEDLELEALNSCVSGVNVLFFGGLTEKIEGEGYDRKTIDIPENQLHLLKRISAISGRIAFIAFGGSVMDMKFVDNVDAVFDMYLGGEAVGEACAKLIFGLKNPCGKLAETFPMSLSDVPSYEYFGKDSDDVEYRESIFVGYRYYETYKKDVRFPFGYGLSYTKFEYSNIKADCREFSGGDLKVTCDIKNIGSMKGKEIVELYIENPQSSFLRPIKELRGFTKVELAPGETKTVSITLNDRSFSIYDERSEKFIIVSGDYKILIGASIKDIRLVEQIKVKGVDYDRDDRKRLAQYFDQHEGVFKISQEQFAVLYDKQLSNLDNKERGSLTIYDSLEKLQKYSFFAKMMMNLFVTAMKIMYKGRDKEDPEFIMNMNALKEGMLYSIVYQSGGMIPERLAEAIVLSANGHHLKSLVKLIRG